MSGQVNGPTITVPVLLKAEAAQMRSVIEQLKKQTSIDLTTKLGKDFSRTLEQLEKMQDQYGQLAINPTIDRKGLNNLESISKGFYETLGGLQRKVSNAGIFEFDLSKDELTILDQYTTKIKEAAQARDALIKNQRQRDAKSVLSEYGDKGLLERAKKIDKFDETKTVAANADIMSKQTQNAIDKVRELEEANERLAAQRTQIERELATLSDQKVRSKRGATMLQRADFLKGFQGKVGQEELATMKNKDALAMVMEPFRESVIDGKIAPKNIGGAELFLKYLGFDPAIIKEEVKKTVDEIEADVMKLFGMRGKGSVKTITEDTASRLLSAEQGASNYIKNATIPSVMAARDPNEWEKEKKAAEASLAQNAAEHQRNTEEISKTQDLITALKELTAALQNANKNVVEKNPGIKAAEGRVQSLQKDQQQKLQEMREQRIRAFNSRIGGPIATQDSFASASQAMSEAEAAQKEAEQFNNSLNSALKRWLGAREIIQLIKRGIREAWNDIKSLDKAMTDIAVVTDMSTNDLWGKVTEYMDVARQYGVTTQGVYQVSGIFYQQGLSANEVMAATTETLKMARISGMQYAEAADAMTSAIRGFKLEMSDAEHITDVYSKIAATTASSSQELATAMSKTASSAESVGSSFENTTAMLATMIGNTVPCAA